MNLSWTAQTKDGVFWIVTIAGMGVLLWKLKRDTGGNQPPDAR